MKLTDEQIIKAWEKCANPKNDCYGDDPFCPYCKYDKGTGECFKQLREDVTKTLNRQKAEIERLNKEVDRLSQCVMYHDGQVVDAIKEFAGKITEIFMRYAHLHSYAEQSRRDYIETVDGYEIEMQSVWDVFSLKKYEMAEYEEMSRLQKNIETIEKERLLTELEKDFRLLVKEMAGE